MADRAAAASFAENATGERDEGSSEEISLTDALASGAPILDVRSPAEFAGDRIPGARSVPLFDDRERAVVGTIFRQLGAGEARRFGSERVEARLEEFVAALREEFAPREQGPLEAVICCARGGERSGAVTQLLRQRGFAVRRLTGGYRAFRSVVRERLRTVHVPRPILLDGLTGCGKTAVLRAIAAVRPNQVLDLEGLAEHRSSLLGAVGLEPVSQKRFESRLLAATDRLTGRWTLIEAESRRVGDREIPPSLFAAMRAAPRITLTATLPQRIDHLSDVYLGGASADSPAGQAALAEISRCLEGLGAYPQVGAEGVRRWRTCLERGEIDEVVRELLEVHYDPRYRHGASESATPEWSWGAFLEERDETVRGWIEELDHIAESSAPPDGD